MMIKGQLSFLEGNPTSFWLKTPCALTPYFGSGFYQGIGLVKKEIHDASVAGSHVHMHFAGNEERSWYFTPQKVETKIHKITVTCSNLTHQTLNMCECFVFSMIFHDVFFMDFSIFFKPPGYLLHTFCLLILVPALTLQKKRSLEISIVASQQML